MKHKPLISKELLKRATRPRFILALPVLLVLSFVLIIFKILNELSEVFEKIGYMVTDWSFK